MVCPASALDKIIIAPTARTIGAGAYQVGFSRKEPILDSAPLTRDLSLKVGLGKRAQLETKIPVGSIDKNAQWAGKYVFMVAHDSSTEIALGFDNLGVKSRTVPYLVASHLFATIDLTAGIAVGSKSVAVFFTGIDYRLGEKLHILTDYNTGNTNYVSVGFKYLFSQSWSIKSGLEAKHEAVPDVMVKITYAASY